MAAERLKREKYLFLEEAGGYEGPDARRRLVERTEELIEQERDEWARLEQIDQAKANDGSAATGAQLPGK